MVTYYNKKDLTSWGEYLLSERRRENIRGDLSKVHHADFENWLEEHRTRRKAPASVPQSEVPQWLIDHLDTAPIYLKNYVLRFFPERRTNPGAEMISTSFEWVDTRERRAFWSNIDRKQWGSAVSALKEKELI